MHERGRMHYECGVAYEGATRFGAGPEEPEEPEVLPRRFTCPISLTAAAATSSAASAASRAFVSLLCPLSPPAHSQARCSSSCTSQQSPHY
jgi:hypothetical protein